MCEMKQEGQFSKNNNLLQYAIQLVCVLKWNKRDSFQKNQQFITVCENETRGAVFKKQQFITMLFNLCPYWNETRGTVFKKKPIYYSMLFNKRAKNNNLLQYFQETVFKKKQKTQFITVCYSTCVHIEMKQDGQFSKKSN